MKPQSRRLVYIGINFVLVPAPVVSQQTSLLFQQAVTVQGVQFQKVELLGPQILLARESPSPLQIRVGIGDAKNPQVGQVLVTAENPQFGLDTFIQEAEGVAHAVDEVWSGKNRLIIFGDATMRELYETTSQHAFQELWETRLGQSSEALKAFGKPIRGGGLRFVMDPISGENDPAQIDVKIESFLNDTSKMFVETVFRWQIQTPEGSAFNPRERLEQMNEYVTNQVQAFISGEVH